MSKMASFIAPFALLALAGTGYAAAAQGGGLTALGKIERGEWQFRASDGTTRSICVTDPQVLLQLEHRGASCSRFVVENNGNGGRVTYSCPSLGNGDTRITVETPRLIRLDTQGITRGLPFAEKYEGRRTGACRTSAR